MASSLPQAPCGARLRHDGARSLQISRGVARAGRRATVAARAESVLIVNTKGGGHAFLGLYLAKELLRKGHQVTLLNDGDKEKVSKKGPYAQYGGLEGEGATIQWSSPTDPSSFPPGPFDVVYDNNGKDLEACQPLIDHFKGKVKHYVFVGSAGAYEEDAVEPARFEGRPRKAKAGHVAVEAYLEQQQGLPYTVFQPLYLYGAYTGKDCEQWFLERILRDRPVPIPGPGLQLTSVTNVLDAASLLAAVPGSSGAEREHFNLSGDRTVTLDGVAKILAKAAGKEAKIVHYDPKAVKLEKSEAFPFRPNHFFASVDKAKRVLGWAPQHSLTGDAPELVERFRASGRLDQDYNFAGDDKVLAAVGG